MWDRWLSPILRPPYHALARSGVLWRILPYGTRPRLVVSQARGRTHYQLVLAGRMAGRFDPKLGVWRIRRPFKLVVDERSLPVPDRASSDADRVSAFLQHPPADG